MFAEREIAILSIAVAQIDYSTVDVLKEMYRREASLEEDLIYGCLGLLAIPSLEVAYEIHLRGVIQKLATSMFVGQRLLLTVVETCHGEWLDGYSTRPAFIEPEAVRAPRLDLYRVLGQANFYGHRGMDITTPACKRRTTIACNFLQRVLVDPQTTMLLCIFAPCIKTLGQVKSDQSMRVRLGLCVFQASKRIFITKIVSFWLSRPVGFT